MDDVQDIPIFNSTSIDTSNSRKTGIFSIIGNLPPGFTRNEEFKFDMALVSGQKAECVLPIVTGVEKEVKIDCELQEELKKEKLMIEQFSALDGYNEIFKLNKISSEKEVKIPNGKEIKKKENSKIIYHSDKQIHLNLT